MESIIVQVKGREIILDKDFSEDFNPSLWLAKKQGKYCYIGVNGPKKNGEKSAVFLHRLLTRAQPGEFVDHINGNTLDNRIANLRKCTRAENSRNRSVSKSSKSGIKGVFYRAPRPGKTITGVWVAAIGVQIEGRNRVLHLGHFDTKEEASAAYNEAARKYHGDYARLN